MTVTSALSADTWIVGRAVTVRTLDVTSQQQTVVGGRWAHNPCDCVSRVKLDRIASDMCKLRWSRSSLGAASSIPGSIYCKVHVLTWIPRVSRHSRKCSTQWYALVGYCIQVNRSNNVECEWMSFSPLSPESSLSQCGCNKWLGTQDEFTVIL